MGSVVGEMEKAIDEHSGVLLRIVQDVYSEPQAVIEPLEACLRAELEGLESRMKEKRQEVREKHAQRKEARAGEAEVKKVEDQAKATTEKKRLLDGVDADEERKCHRQESVREGGEEQQVVQKEQAEEGLQNMDLADDEQDSCFYECSEPSSTLVQCDRCDMWFHAICAGYECDLPTNPEHDGHSIELKAYCRSCLDFNELTHVDVVQQEMEYQKLQKYFERNSGKWSWCPVPQNGQILNDIWNKFHDKFESIEKLVTAAASAAVSEVDAHCKESNGQKHHLKAVFKDLAKNPDKLEDMWPDLEVQYVWLALANSVFSDLKLSFYKLREEEGDIQLQCVECIPKEEREFTFCLLRWNQKVAAQYDLIDEVVVLGSGDVTPDADVAHVVPPPDAGAITTILETIISQEEKKKFWKVGTQLEAEMMDPNYPNYRDTIHPVKVVEMLDSGKAYRCQLLAFKDETNVDIWPAELLHEPRDFSPNESWNKDDKVHFRIYNRKVGKVKVDGAVSKDGIWVKGVVAQSGKTENGRIVVDHVDWERKNESERKVSHVLPTDVRWADDDPCDDVVFARDGENTGPFSTETETARLARLPLTNEDCRSIMKKDTWVRSGVVDHMVSLFNVANTSNGTVLVTNIGLEHALFPYTREVTDMKAFLGQNDPTKMGARWRQRWTNVLDFLLMPVNIGNTHWCLLVVSLRTGKVELWDSLKTPESERYDQIDRERLQGFMRSFSPETPDLHLSIASVPQQKGKSSCGVFMLEFIRAFLNGERDGSKVDVAAARVKEYRSRIANELKKME